MVKFMVDSFGFWARDEQVAGSGCSSYSTGGRGGRRRRSGVNRSRVYSSAGGRVFSRGLEAYLSGGLRFSFHHRGPKGVVLRQYALGPLPSVHLLLSFWRAKRRPLWLICAANILASPSRASTAIAGGGRPTLSRSICRRNILRFKIQIGGPDRQGCRGGERGGGSRCGYGNDCP